MKSRNKRLFRYFKRKSITPYFITIIIILFVILAFRYFELIYDYFNVSGTEKKIDVAKFLGYCLGGILIIWQIWLTNKRTKALENQVILSENAQTQERFKNAVEQLGSNDSTIRLGGIYILHNLAKERKKYQEIIFNILCSFIRQNTNSKQNKNTNLQEVSIEIQTIIDLIFIDENERYVYEKNNLIANLSNSHLEGVSFKKAFLNKANFKQAFLKEANFEDSQLIEANFENSILLKTKFNRANLLKANFEDTSLNGSSFENANIECSSFINSRLEGVNLSNSILIASSFENVCLEGACFEDSILTISNFYNSHLEGVNFNRAHLEGANLNKIHMQGAFLGETHLEGTYISETNLEGVYSAYKLYSNLEEQLNDLIGKCTNLEKTYLGKFSKDLFLEINSSIRNINNSEIENILISKVKEKIGAETIIQNTQQGVLSKNKVKNIINRLLEKKLKIYVELFPQEK